PATEIRPGAVQNAHAAVARISLDQATARELASGGAVVERRGRRLEARRPAVAQPTCLVLTHGITVQAASKDARSQLRHCGVFFVDWKLYCPQMPGDPCEIFRIGDLFVTEELRPSSVGGVR